MTNPDQSAHADSPDGTGQLTGVLARLAASGRVTLAERPGHRPRLRAGDGTEPLSDALREERG